MTRLLSSAALIACLVLPASAAEWPWHTVDGTREGTPCDSVNPGICTIGPEDGIETAAVRRRVDGIEPTKIYDGFEDGAASAILRGLRVEQIRYNPVARMPVQFRVSGFDAMDPAPEGAPDPCVFLDKEADPQAYALENHGACFLYSKDGSSTLEISVDKAQSVEEARKAGLLVFILRSFQRKPR